MLTDYNIAHRLVRDSKASRAFESICLDGLARNSEISAICNAVGLKSGKFRLRKKTIKRLVKMVIKTLKKERHE